MAKGCHRLDLARAISAYPLVQAVGAVPDYQAWVREAERLCGAPEDGAGIIGLAHDDGFIHGLFTYGRNHDLAARHDVFLVSRFVALEIAADRVRRQLLQAVNDWAGRLACQAVRIELADRQTGRNLTDLGSTAALFRATGFTLSGLHFTKARPRNGPAGGEGPANPAGAANNSGKGRAAP